MVMMWMRHENQISCRRKEMAVKVKHFHISLCASGWNEFSSLFITPRGSHIIAPSITTPLFINAARRGEIWMRRCKSGATSQDLPL